MSTGSYRSSSSEIQYDDQTRTRFERNNYTSYGGVVAEDRTIVSESVIQTNSAEETDRYLERAVDIYKDPTPQIIRRQTTETPVTYEQRVLVRYLQPPRLPPPGVMKNTSK